MKDNQGVQLLVSSTYRYMYWIQKITKITGLVDKFVCRDDTAVTVWPTSCEPGNVCTITYQLHRDHRTEAEIVEMIVDIYISECMSKFYELAVGIVSRLYTVYCLATDRLQCFLPCKCGDLTAQGETLGAWLIFCILILSSLHDHIDVSFRDMHGIYAKENQEITIISKQLTYTGYCDA
jgi:hypothetical protein